MFPFRPSRAAIALLEVAEAMLAPEPFERALDDGAQAGTDPHVALDRGDPTPAHPHRRSAAVARRRRPAPPRPEQACVTPLPLTRAARTRAELRA